MATSKCGKKEWEEQEGKLDEDDQSSKSALFDGLSQEKRGLSFARYHNVVILFHSAKNYVVDPLEIFLQKLFNLVFVNGNV